MDSLLDKMTCAADVIIIGIEKAKRVTDTGIVLPEQAVKEQQKKVPYGWVRVMKAPKEFRFRVTEKQNPDTGVYVEDETVVVREGDFVNLSATNGTPSPIAFVTSEMPYFAITANQIIGYIPQEEWDKKWDIELSTIGKNFYNRNV